MSDGPIMLKWAATEDHTNWNVVNGAHLYARFRSKSPITAIKAGARGGLFAEIDGTWRRVRKTRSKTKELRP